MGIAGSTQPLPFGMGGLQRFTHFSPWKDFVHDNFPWLEHRRVAGGEFRARVKAMRLADCSLSLIGASASEVIRTRHLAEASGAGYVKLLWQTAGALDMEQDGRRCALAPGEVTVCDTARPYRIRLADGATFVVLMFPYDWVPGWTRLSTDVCATRLPDGFTARAAIGAALANAGGAADAPPAYCDTALRSMQWMLSAALAQAVSTHGAQGARDERFERARRIIRERLANPQLNADALAAALCMSRRALYLLFEKHRQTPSTLIRDMRLDGAAQALRNPQVRVRKITDVAFDFGFSDYATFSRLFKQRFGQTPSAWCAAPAPAAR